MKHNTVALEQPPSPSAVGTPQAQHLPLQAYFRCRKCRTKLFTADAIVDHDAASGQQNFAYNRRDARASGREPECTSYFLSAELTAAALTQIEGKMCCPKCLARLGGYHWAGMQCSCGAWVAPAVQVVKSKVDPG